MKKLLFVLLLTSSISSVTQSIQAQTALSKQWDKTFGGTDYEYSSAIEQTSDGGYIICGSTLSEMGGDKTEASRGEFDFWIVRMNSKGVKIWDKTFGGKGNQIAFSGNERPLAIQQTADGGFIVGGYSISEVGFDKTDPSNGEYDMWLLKLDSNGNKIWDKSYGGNYSDEISALDQTNDGGYILAGGSYSGANGDKSEPSKGVDDYWIVKVDANGNKIWDKSYGGSAPDALISIQHTSDGGYIVAGNSSSPISGDKSKACQGNTDYWIIKLDFNGNKVWDKTYGGSKPELVSTIKEIPGGGFIVGGHSFSLISGDKTQVSGGILDYWIVRIDANGNKIWDKTFGGSGLNRFHSLDLTKDGGFILGGASDADISGQKSENSKGVFDFWIVKIDGLGNKIWDKTIGGHGYDELLSIHQTNDGGFILGGESGSPISGDKSQTVVGKSDYWIVKLDPTCNGLTADLFALCTGGGVSINVNIDNIQPIINGKPGYELTYKVNGVTKTVSGSSQIVNLANNSSIGTVYSLVKISSGNCTKNLSASLTAASAPLAPSATSSYDCTTGTVTLTASGAPENSVYVWYDDSGLQIPVFSSSSSNYVVSSLTSDRNYFVSVKDGFCESPTTPVIARIRNCPTSYIPIITNNKDGLNDTFKPQDLPDGKYELKMFNRWGTLIFESKDYRNNWPDKEISDGVYYYFLNNSDTGDQFKGWLEVVK